MRVAIIGKNKVSVGVNTARTVSRPRNGSAPQQQVRDLSRNV
jgi:hypothetical protein